MSQQVAVEPARSCLKFRDASTDTLYFVSVTRNGGAGEEASADLAVTDGVAAWTAEGLTAATLKGQAPAKLTHFLSALSELEASKLPYSVEFALREGRALLVRVSWQASPSEPRVLIGASLVPAQPPASVISSMLELLVDNLSELRGLSQQLVVQLKEFEKQAARSQDLVDHYVKNKSAQDRETNIKVAALLNSKKKKLRELQQQLEEAREEIERLKQGGAADAATEPMEEDHQGGAAGPSRAGAAGAGKRRRGGAGGHASSDDEQEGEEEEGNSDGEEGDERLHGSPSRDDY